MDRPQAQPSHDSLPAIEAPVAYVRPVETDRGPGYAVCAGDGTRLAVFATQDAAIFAARQHDLEPALVH